MSRRRFAQKRMAEKKEDGMKASEGRKWRWKARVSEGRGRKAKEDNCWLKWMKTINTG